MKKVGAFLVVLALGLGIWHYMTPETLSLIATESDLRTTRLRRDSISLTTVAVGIVMPKVGAEVRVGSRLSGVVEKLYVNVGDEVERGTVLAKLDDSELVAGIAETRASLELAKAELDFAKSELDRMLRLGDVVADSTVEEHRKTVAVRASRVALEEAALEKIEIQRGYSEIRAPISGTIASVSTNEGETVAASFSAPTFVVIVDLSRLEVQVYVDETDIGGVDIGQEVRFTVDAYPDHEFTGKVRAVLPKANIVNNVVNYVATVDIEESADVTIRPEMTARVHFVLDQREDVLTVARRSLLRSGGRTYVVLRDGDEWKQQPIQTGLMNAERAEVVSGLSEGDVIVADKQEWTDLTDQDKD